ncbi:MAG: tRNA pseudouridine(38-40) synthase TruA [Ekhidna sp.]|nr:tRNA pseudouridine(38-40) synthase TruA [Ekhidna sp.]MBC6427506.1 tRNA pseudouridine(38-40) synthase TruA [Ekhidna sp.]
MRYFMDITYRGTHFSGWQTQPNAITIQEEIEKGLQFLLKKKTPITGSGRTDAGVHAIQQVAHFDADSINTSQLAHKLNALLVKDIAINKITTAQTEAHARFSAASRKYHYRLHQTKDPFKEGESYYFTPELNIEEINRACEIIKNWQNFECFSKVHTEVNHFNCDIYEAKWVQVKSNHLFIIKANRFLRGMVRAITGTLIDVGRGKTTLAEFREILESNDRKRAGRAVPAKGLYLQEVNYPDEIYLD